MFATLCYFRISELPNPRLYRRGIHSKKGGVAVTPTGLSVWFLAADVMVKETITIKNETGICGILAITFARTASQFKSKVQIRTKGKTIDAKSILMIMSMRLVKNTEITITAAGSDEEKAVSMLKALVESNFGEE